jgi:hypothetical protein
MKTSVEYVPRDAHAAVWLCHRSKPATADVLMPGMGTGTRLVGLIVCS